MKKYLIMSAILSIALGASGPAFSQSASGVQDLSKPAHPEPPMLGIHWARGFQPNFLLNQAHSNKGKGGGGGGGGHHKNPPPPPSSPDMTYHGGNILPTATTASIFWGPSWNDSTFVGDKISGLDTWYNGFSDSNYAATSDEYTGIGGQVGSNTLSRPYQSYFDYSTASGGGSTAAILAEVCREITPDSSGNGYYAVYTDLPRGNAGYCAWHSYGTCNGIRVQYAFFWNLDGDPGCDPQSTVTGESEGLAALANVSAHELSEARTDPTGAGWYDSSGAENGDKCAWIFDGPSVTLHNGTNWKLQDEWSNAAYDAGTGYPNSKGQVGCVDGDSPY